MEIQKIFSSYDDGERIYSVLMSEEELSWFSEVQKEFTGTVKAANKAAKRAWLEKQGAGGFLGFGKKTGDSAVKAGRKKQLDDLLKTGRMNPSESGRSKVSSYILNPKRSSLNTRINQKGIEEFDGLRDYRNLPQSPSKFRGESYTYQQNTYDGKGNILKKGKFVTHNPNASISNIQKGFKPEY